MRRLDNTFEEVPAFPVTADCACDRIWRLLQMLEILAGRRGLRGSANCASDIPSRHYILLQLRIRGRDIGRGQSQLAAHDVAALGDGAGLVKSDIAVAPLPAEATIAGQNQTLGGNVLQSFANFGGYLSRAISLNSAMANQA